MAFAWSHLIFYPTYGILKTRNKRVLTMNDPLNITQLEEALTLLGERLGLAGEPPQELIVCGGTSLIACGFVSRATRDVDVLARRTTGTEFVSARVMPEVFVAAATRVAADLDLPTHWLNSDPVDLFEMGMPVGFLDRLQSRAYGTHLTVWYIGRLDQIHSSYTPRPTRGRAATSRISSPSIPLPTNCSRRRSGP